MPPRPKRARSTLPARSAEVLDVHGATALLMVSADTVYDLFGRGELPGRKVGRKWITTRSAVLRWIENTSMDDALARALERGDGDALEGDQQRQGEAQIQGVNRPDAASCRPRRGWGAWDHRA